MALNQKNKEGESQVIHTHTIYIYIYKRRKKERENCILLMITRAGESFSPLRFSVVFIFPWTTHRHRKERERARLQLKEGREGECVWRDSTWRLEDKGQSTWEIESAVAEYYAEDDIVGVGSVTTLSGTQNSSAVYILMCGEDSEQSGGGYSKSTLSAVFFPFLSIHTLLLLSSLLLAEMRERASGRKRETQGGRGNQKVNFYHDDGDVDVHCLSLPVQ